MHEEGEFEFVRYWTTGSFETFLYRIGGLNAIRWVVTETLIDLRPVLSKCTLSVYSFILDNKNE